MTIVLDTTILIDHLRGSPDCRRALHKANRDGERLIGSVLTRAEILAGMRSHERRDTDELLGSVTWEPVSQTLADRAGELARTYLRSHRGISLVDYVVAATALHHAAPLWTANVRHFPMFVPGSSANVLTSACRSAPPSDVTPVTDSCTDERRDNPMARYIILLPVGEARWAAASPEEKAAGYEAHGKFTALLEERGHKVTGGAELTPASATTTITRGPDGFSVSDGPYAEATEHVTGFYSVESDDLADLVECCKVLAAHEEALEIRPVVERES